MPPSTAVVSHAFSMREFGSAPAAIGQTVSLNRRSYTVIGVLPPGFRYMTPADVYLLLEPQVAANYRGMQSRSSHTNLYAVGRLKPGVDVDLGACGNAEHRGGARTGTSGDQQGHAASTSFRSPTASSGTWRQR